MKIRRLTALKYAQEMRLGKAPAVNAIGPNGINRPARYFRRWAKSPGGYAHYNQAVFDIFSAAMFARPEIGANASLASFTMASELFELFAIIASKLRRMILP